MGRNRRRLFSSDSEEEIVTIDLPKNRKRNRIIEQYSSSEDEDTNNNREKIDETYIQKVRKIKRNSGKRYCIQTGNIVPEKIFENKDCRCRNAYAQNYDEEERKNNFEKFWGLGDFKKQNILLYEAVEHKIVKRRRPKNGKRSPKNWSFRYLLNSKNGKVPVCKKFFLDTFKVSEGRLNRVLNSANVGNDLRGTMAGSSRKISEEEKMLVQNHIKSFPKFESHYTRSHNPNRKYLHPDLTLRKMFNLYELHCEENQIKPLMSGRTENI